MRKSQTRDSVIQMDDETVATHIANALRQLPASSQADILSFTYKKAQGGSYIVVDTRYGKTFDQSTAPESILGMPLYFFKRDHRWAISEKNLSYH